MTALLARDGSWYFTSESVSEGHPDKVADQISDTILDACLARDPDARVACETMVSKNHVTVGGEYGFKNKEDKLSDKEIEELVRGVVREIGYEEESFHWKELTVCNRLVPQSSELASLSGAGDQGIMFGYATNETPSLMPAPIHYAHEILRKLSEFWHTDAGSTLGPDAKSQVTLRYEGARPVALDNLVVSVQHKREKEDVRAKISPVVRAVFEKSGLDIPKKPEEEWFLVNPSGSFTQGGPDADAGLTGRKIIVDTYGGAAPHGGGAFSGKDATKVDRSAAYATRYLAKNIVAAGLAPACLIQVSYAIGRADPCSFYVHLLGAAKCDEEDLERAVQKIFPLTPYCIIERLHLTRPNYATTAKYGHFGRNYDPTSHAFSWENTDLVEVLSQLRSD